MQFLKTDTSKSYGWIFMKFSGNVLNGTGNKSKEQDLGSDLDPCLDHLDPGFLKGTYSQIILGWFLMIVQELGSLGRCLHSPSVLVYVVANLNSR